MLAMVVLIVPCALVHAWQLPVAGLASYPAFLLLPGVGLYVLLNGTLLFGPGPGPLPEWLVIVGASAAVWAMLLLVLLSVPWRGRSGGHRGQRPPDLPP